jgi:hypothetical protein
MNNGLKNKVHVRLISFIKKLPHDQLPDIFTELLGSCASLIQLGPLRSGTSPTITRLNCLNNLNCFLSDISELL